MDKYYCLLLGLTLIFSPLIRAETYEVKQDGTGDYTTIQGAVDAAANTDTIVVWPGIYNENVTILGKSLTLASLFWTTGNKTYIDNTIIDGQNTSSCIRIKTQNNDTSTVCGFTIRNGKGYGELYWGGGIYIRESSVKVLYCHIHNNWAIGGGGVLCRTGYLFISGSVINNNHAHNAGGGICLTSGSNIQFDSINLNSVFLNYSVRGSDFSKSSDMLPLKVFLDTATVLQPDGHYFYSGDMYGNPINDIELHVLHGKIEAVNQNLFVAEWGDDGNSGTSPENPLKSISFAFKKIVSDSLHPDTIFVSPGIYSPSTTGEKFPLSLRSYVSLIGTDTSNTLLDAEHLSPFAKGINLTRYFTIKNLTFQNGFGNTFQEIGDYGGIHVYENLNVIFENLQFFNNVGQKSTGILSKVNNYMLNKNITVKNGIGGIALSIYQKDLPQISKHYLINCLIEYNRPDPYYIYGGGGFSAGGVYLQPGKSIGYLINCQITNTVVSQDPLFGDGGIGSAINPSLNARLFVINSTIGNCEVQNVDAGALGLADGAEVDICNSILYFDEPREIYLGAGFQGEQPVTLNAYYNNVEGGVSNIVNAFQMHNLNWFSGTNIDSDPLWDTTAAIPYAIPPESPCRNTGTPMYSPGMQPPYIIQQDTVYSLVTPEYDTIVLPSTDLRGKTRIMEGRIDMGAYEYDPFTGTDDQKLPAEVEVISVYPNPFYSNVFVSLNIKKAGYIKAEIYDMQGHLLKTLMDTDMPVGSCTLTWDGKDELGWDVKIGEYLLKLSIDGRQLPGAKVVRGKWR